MNFLPTVIWLIFMPLGLRISDHLYYLQGVPKESGDSFWLYFFGALAFLFLGFISRHKEQR